MLGCAACMRAPTVCVVYSFAMRLRTNPSPNERFTRATVSSPSSPEAELYAKASIRARILCVLACRRGCAAARKDACPRRRAHSMNSTLMAPKGVLARRTAVLCAPTEAGCSVSALRRAKRKSECRGIR